MTHTPPTSRSVPTRPAAVRAALVGVLAGAMLASVPAAFTAPPRPPMGQPVLGATPPRPNFLLLDGSLHASPLQLAGIRAAGRSVALVDAGGTQVPLTVDDVSALVPLWWAPPAPDGGASPLDGAPADLAVDDALSGLLRVTDGQRFTGRISSAGQPVADAVAWNHPVFGTLVFPLDNIRELSLRPPGPAAPGVAAGGAGSPPAKNDRVLMVNGDVVTGFVESVGATVTISVGGKALGAPLEQIAKITLQNPSRTPDPLPRLWLGDGTVVSVARFGQVGVDGRVPVEIACPSLGGPSKKTAAPSKDRPSEAVAVPSIGASSIDLGAIAAMVADASRLVPLAQLTIASQKAVGDRRRYEPVEMLWNDVPVDAVSHPVLDAPDVFLPGPMAVEWPLPGGAARLAGWAELPHDSLVWGDCVFSIGFVGPGEQYHELFSQRVNGQRPVAEFNVALAGAAGRLRITVDPGEHGPIQDRLLLRRALILLGPPAR